MKWFRLLAWVIVWASWITLPVAAVISSREANRFSHPPAGTGTFPFCGNAIAEPLAFALNHAFPGIVLGGAALLWLAARRGISTTAAMAYCFVSAVIMTVFWLYADRVFHTHFADAARGVWWLP